MNNYAIFFMGYTAGMIGMCFIYWLLECVNPRQLVLYWCHCGYRFRGVLSRRVKLCPRCGCGMYAERVRADD